MDIGRLCQRLTQHHLVPSVVTFAEAARDIGPHWKDRLVVYQSAEDPNLEYRAFVEDVVLGLEVANARLLPRFRHLRAHHNKVFGELLSKALCDATVRRPVTDCYGCFEEFDAARCRLPAVVKTATGAGSSGVGLASTIDEVRRLAARASCSRGVWNGVKEHLKRRLRNGYIPYSTHRQRFIVQAFLPGLEGDYKILCYGSRLYVLERMTREGDFRASGSGRFSWPKEPDDRLLSYASELRAAFDVPCCSLDVANTSDGLQLLEAQFVDFGPLTLEDSQRYFTYTGGRWRTVDEPSNLEAVFADCLVEFATARGWL